MLNYTWNYGFNIKIYIAQQQFHDSFICSGKIYDMIEYVTHTLNQLILLNVFDTLLHIIFMF